MALVFALLIDAQVFAEPGQNGDGQQNHGPPVYQQHPFNDHDREERRDFRRDSRFVSPQVSAGWFQRPYPYHLDYYKMRYGGSYAPYFGNLYGTPQVVNYPPYYGPYYNGYGGEHANGFGQSNSGGLPMEYAPNSGVIPGAGTEQSVPVQTQSGASTMKAGGEALPAPTPLR